MHAVDIELGGLWDERALAVSFALHVRAAMSFGLALSSAGITIGISPGRTALVRRFVLLFSECINENSGEIAKCQVYLDMVQACKRGELA